MQSSDYVWKSLESATGKYFNKAKECIHEVLHDTIQMESKVVCTPLQY